MTRFHHVFALLFSSVCMAACDGRGEVVVSGLDDFGSVRSAQWILSDSFTILTWSDGELVEGNGSVRFAPLNLRSWNYGCDDLQDFVERWAELSQAVIDADGDDEAQCDAMGELVAWQSSDPNDLPEERAIFSVVFTDGSNELPDEGTYFEEEVVGVLTYSNTVGCEDAIAWDVDTCSMVETECGEFDSFTVRASEFVIESVADNRVVGTFSGSVQLDDDLTGTVDAEFDAEVCTVTVPDFLIY